MKTTMLPPVPSPRKKREASAIGAASKGVRSAKPAEGRTVERVLLAAGGRIVIPVAMRKAMGLKDGDMLRITYEGGTLRLASQERALKKLQAYMKENFADRKLADELIAERKREAKREH